MTWVELSKHLQNLPASHGCSGHLMVMARKVAFFPASLAQPSLGWDSFLCLGVLVWPRSD